MKDQTLVVATKRSGHHAIIRWIAEQMEETIDHKNDVIPTKLACGKVEYTGGNHGDVYGGNGVVKTIYSLEDATTQQVQQIQEQFSKNNIPLNTIIIVRDIRNVTASIIKSTNRHLATGRLNGLITAWKSHVDLFLREHSECFILYDKWFCDKSYRRLICNELNIPFTDAGLNNVSRFGGYSSFDRDRFQNNAQEMDVLNRWVHYKNNNVYNKYITEHLLELNKKVFGV